MEMFFGSLNQIGDALSGVFAWASPLGNLYIVSLACAFVLLYLFKQLSNQQKIKFHKDKIFGYILEIGLYRDQFGRTMWNQLLILKHNIIYMRYVMLPFVVLMLPVVLLCLQIENRMGYAPMAADQHFIITARLDPARCADMASDIMRVQCETSPGIVLETPAVRIAGEGSVFWRARVLKAGGPQYVRVAIDGGRPLEKTIVTGPDYKRFSPSRTKSGSMQYLLSTAEKPVPAQSSFQELSVAYAAASYPFLFWRISAIIYFFILSLVFGLLMIPFIKVKI